MKFRNLKKNKEYYVFYYGRYFCSRNKMCYNLPKLYKAKFNQIVGLTQSHIMLDFYPRLKVDVLFPEKVEMESQILGNKIHTLSQFFICRKGDWIIADNKQTIKQILRNIYDIRRSTIYVTKETRENYQESIKVLKRHTV